ncbi:oligosaccharide repeat unit polymerase [Polynucleobacter paneuropaeus]|uniref:O-antigen polymerase n=1 Tax=Polynucleobacter paneuropaeus TaxID=2527775 RepID=UPI001BFDFEA6|nr:O-antigen polymerase [Polynucleobacter paneuropaeus]QWD48033.1 oligosaccharide repeat unit polymerase [Polynucleobacter paneuropaeus]QWD52909.1 oligosaccharide repeat unit polymerase [Polynucleobacter paneuropaeus]QWD57823.1 oligosaccharide repeat unit polymerase [Polynucleobacter paneuropaeus]
MISTIFLLISLSIFSLQFLIDKSGNSFFNPKNMFQIYFITQLQLILFLGTNFNIPGFLELSILTSEEIILNLSLLFLFGYLSYLFGYYATRNFSPPNIAFGYEIWNKKRANLICLFLFATGYLAFIYLLEINGGYETFILERESWRAGGMIGQGWLVFPATTMLAIAAVGYILVNKEKFRKKFGFISLVILVIAAIFPALSMGFRGMMILPVLQILFIYDLKVKEVKFRKILTILVGLIILFTGYGIYRESLYLMDGNFSFSVMYDFAIDRSEFFFSIFLRSKGADIVSVIVQKINGFEDYMFFLPALFEALTIPIPSAIWSGKPEALSILFSKLFFGLSGGVSPTIIGEMYWHAGGPGVIVGLFILGFISRQFVNASLKYKDNDSVCLLLAMFFPLLVMMAEAVQGYINGMVLIYLVSTVIFILFSGRKISFKK